MYRLFLSLAHFEDLFFYNGQKEPEMQYSDDQRYAPPDIEHPARLTDVVIGF